MRGGWVVLGLLAYMAPVLAQQPQSVADARFQVSGYAVEGRALLKSEDFTRVVSPYVGHGKTAADLERARLALQDTYHNFGHCTVRVALAHTEPKDGMVTFRVSEVPASEVRECLPALVLDEPARRGQSAAAPGVAIAPYVEGAGARGLSVLSGAPAQDSPGLVPEAPAKRPAVQSEPAKSVATQVLAEAKDPTDGRAPFIGTAGVVADPQPAEARPLVVAQAEQVKPAPPAKAPPPAPATVPVAPAALKFDITRYDVEGNTLLKPEIVDRALAPYTGPGRDFGDVQRALEALQAAYTKEGWGGIEIRLPEQELDKGVVRLRVVEPRIAKITVEGNEHFSEANIRRSVPALREGETPNSREIGKGIRLANENPSKQSAVVLRASEREDHLDATIRVADVDPKRFSVSLDNTGNVETQRERLGLAYQHSNMFGLDHVMTLQFITAPKNYNDVVVFGLGYRIPIYSRGDSVDFVAGYSNVDSGTVQDLFVVAGAGTVFALRYNQNLPRWGDLEPKFSYGFDYRAYQNDVTPVGNTFKLVPDITVHPVSVTYSGAWGAEGKGGRPTSWRARIPRPRLRH